MYPAQMLETMVMQHKNKLDDSKYKRLNIICQQVFLLKVDQ
jgi:hypothetical protein